MPCGKKSSTMSFFVFFHFKPSIAIWFFQISNSGKALDVRKLHTRQDPWIWRRAGVKLRNSLIVLSLLLLFACLFVCLFVFLAFFVCLFFIFWGGLLPHGAFCVMWEDRVYFCVIRGGCPPPPLLKKWKNRLHYYYGLLGEHNLYAHSALR